MELPEYLKSGEIARLFPTVSETSREKRAASIFLSVLAATPPFSKAIFAQLGERTGVRSVVNSFTEVVFVSDGGSHGDNRPDGLIEIHSGRRRWSALIEAKIGNGQLETDQIERYLRLARDNNIDAVLTISNAFSGRPEHSPVSVNGRLLRRVRLFHLSWSAILTTAMLLHEQATVDDPQQAILLREFTRFFLHPSAGVAGFDSMPAEWSEAIQQLQTGGRISKSVHAEAIVCAWHQELRDISLKMSRQIGLNVTMRLSRQHANDPAKRLHDDIDALCKHEELLGLLHIPAAASDLKLVADLKGRVLRAAMTLTAPKDKKTDKARLNWLLRQLKDAPVEDVTLSVSRAYRSEDFTAPLSNFMAQPEIVNQTGGGAEIKSFEITLTFAGAKRFSGRRKVIEALELLAPTFYERIGQYLKAWTPSPPKPRHSVDEMGAPGAADKETAEDDAPLRPEDQASELT